MYLSCLNTKKVRKNLTNVQMALKKYWLLPLSKDSLCCSPCQCEGKSIHSGNGASRIFCTLSCYQPLRVTVVPTIHGIAIALFLALQKSSGDVAEKKAATGTLTAGGKMAPVLSGPSHSDYGLPNRS